MPSAVSPRRHADQQGNRARRHQPARRTRQRRRPREDRPRPAGHRIRVLAATPPGPRTRAPATPETARRSWPRCRTSPSACSKSPGNRDHPHPPGHRTQPKPHPQLPTARRRRSPTTSPIPCRGIPAEKSLSQRAAEPAGGHRRAVLVPAIEYDVKRSGNGHAASRIALIQPIWGELVDGRHARIVDDQAVISGGGSRLAGADCRRCRRRDDLMAGKEVGGDRGAGQEDAR